MAEKNKPPRRILVIDVGGSHVKFRIGDRGRIRRFPSGLKLSAADMVKQVLRLLGESAYDAVSVGYPGFVSRGRIVADPYNLGGGWVGFDFGAAFGKPVRLINDATMQAVGSYAGGRMLFLGLGTGLGVTLIRDGIVEPMELGHLPYKKHRAFEYYVGERGRRRLGTKKWRKKVYAVIDQLKGVLEADYVVIGGGNAQRLKKVPANTRLGDNLNAFVGGLLIWQCSDPTVLVLDVAGHRKELAGVARA
jgi:polyphosphate glucokinase